VGWGCFYQGKCAMTGKNVVLILMWLYVCKSAIGCQLSEQYHATDILVDPEAVIHDLIQKFL
jgi:hypothetical protein